MDAGLLHGVWIAALLAVFAAIVVWAWSGLGESATSTRRRACRWKRRRNASMPQRTTRP